MAFQREPMTNPAAVQQVHARFLERQTSVRQFLRFLLLLFTPLYLLLAIIHASVSDRGFGCLALVGFLPTWSSGALAFHLVRRRRDGKIAKLAGKPASLAMIDAVLCIVFAGGISAVACSMALRSYWSDEGTLVTGTFALTPLIVGLVIHLAFVIDAYITLTAHLDSKCPHCTECGSRISRRHRGQTGQPEKGEAQSSIPSWAGKGAARGVYDVYETLLAEQGIEESDEETEPGNRRSEETLRGGFAEAE